MKLCEECSFENSNKAKYCAKCGEALSKYDLTLLFVQGLIVFILIFVHFIVKLLIK